MLEGLFGGGGTGERARIGDEERVVEEEVEPGGGGGVGVGAGGGGGGALRTLFSASNLESVTRARLAIRQNRWAVTDGSTQPWDWNAIGPPECPPLLF